MPLQLAGLDERILDKALEQGEASSWERLLLHTVAEALGIGLDEILCYFQQKDDLVEAWFDRADHAMLVADRDPDFPGLPLQERLHLVICSWLDALAPHRRLTREMLAYKLEPGHVHLQVLGIMRISRTVQWFRETAHQDSTGLQRIIDESVLSSIYLAAFARWLFNDSGNGSKGKAFLETALHRWLDSGYVFSKQSTTSARTAATPQQPGN
jgi:ubiquinone biosynthesis protein COQ9